MTQSVKDAVAYLSQSYGDIAREVESWEVDPKEISAALDKAKPDTAEAYVLNLLAKANPIKNIKNNADSTKEPQV